MYALVLLLVTVASSGGNAEVTRTAEIVDFEVGGSQITFTLDGFSLDEIEHLKCVVRFHDGRESIEIEAAVTSDALNAICRLTPDINVGGVDVDLEVATMSSDTSIVGARTLFINPIAQTEMKVVENWNANELTLTWNPDYFAQFFNPGATFVMQLMVYVASSFEGDFKASQIVQVVGQNIGTATVTVSSLNVARFLSIQFPYFYVLRAVGTQSDVYSASYIFAPTVGMDESTAGRTCSKWLSFANASATPEEIHKCPSTLCQVQIDSNFVLSEYPPQIVELANGALNNHVLYYERVPTHSGYAQSCSYNQLTGHLATASPAQASWINFVSKHISYMDNYFSDVWPYMICCLQSNSQSYCDLFHQKRPIDTGHEYPGGECPCLGAGDPHMATFESVYYDFMGYGEFWLIHGPEGSDFGVQGRMGPIWEWQTASYFKAVAIREGNTTLQIELRGGKLIVILDGKELQFKQLPASLPLERISLDINTNRAEVRTQTGFSIIFEGWGETGNVYGRAAQHNKGKGFMGIFGNFDDNPNNDLTSRDGFVIPPENIRDLSLLHHRFGMTWLVNRTESFFVYEDGKSWDDFVNIDFGPTDQYPDPATLPEEVRAICGDSLFCLYEYVVTGDLEMAVGIARIETEYEELKEELGRTIPMCDMLSEPANGRVHVNGYFDGSSATYSCDSEYDFDSGDKVRTCSVVEEFTQWTGVEPVCIWTCKTCLESTEFELTHNPSDCSKFFLCSFGQRLSLDCPRSQFFNPETLSCSNDYICLNPPGC